MSRVPQAWSTAPATIKSAPLYSACASRKMPTASAASGLGMARSITMPPRLATVE